MEEKNLALLGFISKAADYLKDNLSEESLEIKQLEEVDLDKIKNELSNKIGSSFHGASSSENLINAGKDAFDCFISDNNKEKDEDVINHLMDILNNPSEDGHEEDEYLNLISNAISNEEEINKPVNVEVYKDARQDEEIDSIFSEILANESIIDDFVSKNGLEEKEELVDDSEVNISSNEFKQILEDVLGDVYNKINKNNDQIIEKFKDLEKEIENQKAIIENKKDDNHDVSLENVKEDSNEDVVSNYFKNLNDSFSKEDASQEKENDADPFVTVDDILTLEDGKDDEETIDENDDIEEETKLEGGLSLLDEEYISAFHNRPLEDMFVLNPCLDALEQQEEAERLRIEKQALEKEEKEKAKIEKELAEIFEEVLDAPEIKETETDNEELEEEDYKPLLNQDYIDDYNSRPIEEIYITNPSLDYVEKQQEMAQEAELVQEDTINVDEIKNKALRDLEKQILESEKIEEELKASLVTEESVEADNIITSEEYLNDYNNRSIEDIYITNPGADSLQEAQLEEETDALEEKEDFEQLFQEGALTNQEYLDDYNNRLIDDICIVNPGVDKQDDETSKQEEEDVTLEIEQICNEITDTLLDIDGEEFEEDDQQIQVFNQEYIDDYNNRSIEDIYIANPGALEEEKANEELSEEVSEPLVQENNEESEEIVEDAFTNEEYLDEYNNRSIEDICITNPGSIEEEKIEETVEEKPEETDSGIEISAKEDEKETQDINEEKDSVLDLLDDYDETISNDISNKKLRQEELRREIYNSIKSIYPYLSNGFIKGVYDLKDSLANDYKEDEEIIILHRLHFKDVGGLRKFVDIIINHDYLVNVDEKQMIVDTFKEHINSDGKILTDIFEVANQAKLLTGEYEGYRIIEKDA